MNSTTQIMKSFKFIMLGIALIGYSSANAQGDYFSRIKPAKKFSVGANFGLTHSFTDAPTENSSTAFGLNVKYSVSHTLGLRASYSMGTLVGDRSDTKKSVGLNSFSFENNFSAVDLSAVFSLGNISFLRPARNLQYFATLGLGYLFNDAVGKLSNPADIFSTPNLATDNKYSESEIFVPVGLGLKYNLNEKLDLGLSTQFNFTSNDKIDAFDYSTNTNKSVDYFVVTGLSLSYKFGTDKNQSSHVDWINPVESIYSEIDSINNSLKNLMADTDGDGVGDYFDKDNETPEGVKTYGDGTAVDTDNDGVPDSQDKEIFSLVTDVDENGVAKDDDGDGIPNEIDAEPNSAAGAMVDSKGKAFEIKEYSSYDCDNVTLPTIIFDNGSAKISASSYGVLYTLAEKLRMCPSLSITATGYTRSKSGERLAWKRANAIIDHLEANYGIERSRISTDYSSEYDVEYASRRIDFSK